MNTLTKIIAAALVSCITINAAVADPYERDRKALAQSAQAQVVKQPDANAPTVSTSNRTPVGQYDTLRGYGGR